MKLLLFLFFLLPIAVLSQKKSFSASFYTVYTFNADRTKYTDEKVVNEKNYIIIDKDKISLLCKSCSGGERTTTYFLSDDEENYRDTTSRDGHRLILLKAYTSQKNVTIGIGSKAGKITGFRIDDGKTVMVFQGIEETKN